MPMKLKFGMEGHSTRLVSHAMFESLKEIGMGIPNFPKSVQSEVYAVTRCTSPG